MPRGTKKDAKAPAKATANKAPGQRGTVAAANQNRGLPPGVTPTVKAASVSLVGQGASGNANLAAAVEQAMTEGMEAAQQRGEKDPKRLLAAKVKARQDFLDSLA